MGFRYIGSKTKIVNEIISKVNLISEKGDHIIDLMCGTGAVSEELRKEGYKVTAVDVMSQSIHHTKVRLLLNSEPKFEKAEKFIKNNYTSQNILPNSSNYKKILNLFNNAKPIKGYFWKEFSPEGNPQNGCKPRKYFTAYNAGMIDSVRMLIKKMKASKALSDTEYSLLIHDLIMAANDVANIAGTYGHYLSNFVSRAKQKINFYPTKFSKVGSTKGHRIIQGFAEIISKNLTCDLCYIDPPYMKRQYAANYHILETLARGDEPEAIGVSGLRPWRDQYSDFCSKVKIRKAFEKIFKNMKCPHFLISYSEDGLLSKQELIDFFSKFGEVKLYEFSYKRFRSNKSNLNSELKEYLFHLRKL